MLQHTFLIPKGLDIDALISSNPPAIKNFQREKAFYIVDIISMISARNKDVGDDGGYVPLNAVILRKKIGNRYFEYLKWLLDRGVLECNGHFSVALNISRKYRFADKYNTPLVGQVIEISQWMGRKVGTPTPVSSPSYDWSLLGINTIEMPSASPLSAKLPTNSFELTQSESEDYYSWMRMVYPNVHKWYDEGGLQVDSHLADYYNDALWRFRTDGYLPIVHRWDSKRLRDLPKDPTHQQRANCYNILDMQRGRHNAHFDPNVMRLHSTITTMNKDFRPAISWRGKPLVTVDISNSQPYLLAALLNPEFWVNDGKAKSVITLDNLPYSSNYISLYPITNLITLCNFLEQSQPPDMLKFKQIVSSGRFYEQLAQMMSKPKSGKSYTRGEMKKLMFTVLFSGNEAYTQRWAKAKREFAKIFPSIDSLIQLVQSNGNKMLPCLLQRLESYLVYNLILPRLEIEMPNVPVFTIHDGIVTLKGNEHIVAKVMREELYYATNVMPSYKFDYWDDNELKYNLYWNETLYDEWRSCMLDCMQVRW